jgi:putative methyltransferase (TIGR04325 family)
MLSFLSKIKQLLISPSWGWKGNYASWADAQKKANGYDDNVILEKVKEALLKVKKGDAVYERDSVLFNEIEYSWPFLSALMWIAANNKGMLNIIDFGGSLGSSYFQNKHFLETLEGVKWNIVEQEKFVDCGRTYFQDNQLKFYYTIAECLENEKVNALVSSSTIQYIENGDSLLDEMVNHGFEYIVFDLIPTWDQADRITLQVVPPSIYTASYPCRIMNEQKFLSHFEKHYTLVTSFESSHTIYIEGAPLPYKGYIFRKK